MPSSIFIHLILILWAFCKKCHFILFNQLPLLRLGDNPALIALVVLPAASGGWSNILDLKMLHDNYQGSSPNRIYRLKSFEEIVPIMNSTLGSVSSNVMSHPNMIGLRCGVRQRLSLVAKLRSCATMLVLHLGWENKKKCSCVWIRILHHFQAGVDDNISIMGVGNTQGAMYALKKMQISNGGNGGRIITTAAIAGLLVKNYMIKI